MFLLATGEVSRPLRDTEGQPDTVCDYCHTYLKSVLLVFWDELHETDVTLFPAGVISSVLGRSSVGFLESVVCLFRMTTGQSTCLA